MPRGRKKGTGKKINQQKEAEITKAFLEQDPEGFEKVDDFEPEKLVIAKYVPEHRTVIFLNGRDTGVELRFHYASKTHPLKTYLLHHGHEYTLPVEIIEHLENCRVFNYGYRKGVDDLPEFYVTGCKYLYQFRTKRAA
jgi:hypothetical protein